MCVNGAKSLELAFCVGMRMYRIGSAFNGHYIRYAESN